MTLLDSLVLVLAPGLAQIGSLPSGAGGEAPTCVHEIDRFRPAESLSGDRFGQGLAFDGARAVIGAAGRGSPSRGAAYVFLHTTEGWEEEAAFYPPDTPGSISSDFGGSLAIDGNRVLVGASGESSVVDDAGAAFLYERSGIHWSAAGVLRASDPNVHANFGRSVALDGDFALVGATGADDYGAYSGCAYVFERSPGGDWFEAGKLLAPDGKDHDGLGVTVALRGETAFVGTGLVDSATGAVYVFVRGPSGWGFAQKLISSDGHAFQRFGVSVSVLGDRLAVGASTDLEAGVQRGAVYLFELGAGGWEQAYKIRLASGNDVLNLGSAVALGHDLVLARGRRDGPIHDPGNVQAFVRAPEGWVHLAEFDSFRHDAPESSQFGNNIAWGGAIGLIGSRSLDDTGLVLAVRLPGPSGETLCGCPAGPCGNDDASAGCANSLGTGALLLALGETDPDFVSLFARGLPAHSRALFVRGDASAGIPFGDGLLCLGGTLRPLSPLAASASVDGLIGIGRCFGDTSVTEGEPGLPGSGTARTYQVIYRDEAGPCSSSWNVSSAVRIVW